MTTQVFGREAEREWLASGWRRAVDGQRRTLVVVGEPGIGKSALLADAAIRMAAIGFTVCTAAAQEIERYRPFGVIRRAIGEPFGSRPGRDRLHSIEQRMGNLDERVRGLVDLPELGFQWVDALTDLVDSVAATGPTAILVDDAQWADEASIEALATLHDRLYDRPVLLVLATRPPPAGSAIGRFIRRTRPDDVLEIGPLDDRAVSALVRAQTGREPTADDLARVRRADGNPLFIVTLLAGDDAPDGTVDLPDSVRRLVARTLDELGDDVRRLLEVAAVIGRPVPLTTVSVALDETLATTLRTAEIALNEGLLVDGGEGIAFRHDLVRDVIYEGIHPSIRAALHLTVGQRLLAGSAAVSDIASHFVLGAQPGDVAAADVLRSAAAEIGRIAPREAAQLLESVLSILPDDHPARDRTVVELVQAYVFCDRLDASLALVDEMTERGVNPGLGTELHNARAQIFFLRGEPRRAAKEFAIIAAPGRDTDDEAVILADAAVSALLAVDLDAAREFAERSLDVGSSGTARPSPLGHSVLGWLAALSGDLDTGLAACTTALEIADRGDGLEGHRRIPHLFHAQCLLWADQAEEGLASLRRGRRLSAELAMGWDEPMYHALAADERWRAGEWDDTLAEVEAGLRRSDEVGSHVADSWLYSHRARVEFGRGEPDAAAVTLDIALKGLAGAGGQSADQVWWLRGLIATLDDPEEGLVILDTLWGRLDELGVALRQFELAPDLIEVARRANRAGHGREVADRVAALAADHPSPMATTATIRCGALVAGDADALDRAAASYQARALPIDALRTRTEAAIARRQTGDGRAAVAALDRCRRELALLGADGLVAWYLGDAQRSAPVRAATGWESLTRSERAVVELVGQGLTNAEIAEALSISRRTVESHLYHAYPKLQLSSRVELALEAAQRFEAASSGP